jgi:hypothetical protein
MLGKSSEPRVRWSNPQTTEANDGLGNVRRDSGLPGTHRVRVKWVPRRPSIGFSWKVRLLAPSISSKVF